MKPQPQAPNRFAQIIQIIVAIASLILGFFIGLIALAIAVGGIILLVGANWWRHRRNRTEPIETSYRVIDQ